MVGRFEIALFGFQILSFVLFGLFTQYSDDASSIAAYGLYQNVHVMIFVGFGFLMTFMRKYGWGAVGFTFLFAIVAAQWGILLLGFAHRVYKAAESNADWKLIDIDINSLIGGDFCAAAVLITLGGVIGKISHLQMFMVALLESVFFAFNETLVFLALGAVDAGGAMVDHAFGAYFGLMLSFMIGNPGKGVKCAETSHKNGLFAMIGSLFLWMYWPSFNAAVVPTADLQQMAIVNTVLSIGSSALAVFSLSLALRGGKLDMEDIQNATLAGGVAMGACCSMRVGPWGALLIGYVAGLISVLGFVYGSGIMRRFGIDDTCGIHNLHGLPAVFGAVASAIASGFATEDRYGGQLKLWAAFPAMAPCSQCAHGNVCDRTSAQQAGYQIAALAVSMSLALLGGAITGALVRLPFFQPLEAKECFEDSVLWIIEDGDMAELSGDADQHPSTMVKVVPSPK